MKVNILGTEYEIKQDVDPQDDPVLKGKFGYQCYHQKTIVIADLRKVDRWKDEPQADIDAQNRATLRHEIIHAFLQESGLWGSALELGGSWSENEEMVDWIALQMPKMVKAMMETGCLGAGEIDRRINDRGMGVDRPIDD